MQDIDIRLECLRIAVGATPPGDTVRLIDAAEKLYQFASGQSGKTTPIKQAA